MPNIALQPLQLSSIQFEPVSFDEENRTVVFNASDESEFERMDWYSYSRYRMYLEHSVSSIDLGRVKNAACMFLEDHRQAVDFELGKVVEAKIKSKTLQLTVKLHPDEKGERYFQRLKNGTQSPTSVGARPIKLQLVEKAEFKVDPITGNKTQTKLALMKAVEWELMEYSAVPVPAISASGVENKSLYTESELITCSIDNDPGFEHLKELPGGLSEDKPPVKKVVQKTNKGKKNMDYTELTEDQLIEQLTAATATIEKLESERNKDAVVTNALQEQMTLLHQQVGTLAAQNQETVLRSQYNDLQALAINLKSEGKLTVPEFEKFFNAENFTALTAEHGDVRLSSVGAYLEAVKDRQPILTMNSQLDGRLGGTGEKPKNEKLDQAKLKMEQSWQS
jgi:hypothetical protein